MERDSPLSLDSAPFANTPRSQLAARRPIPSRYSGTACKLRLDLDFDLDFLKLP